jgi:hypothetical protein
MQGGLLSIQRFLREFALVAVAALALFAASGCGGSDSSATAVTVETGSLSKAAFIKKAINVCRATRVRFEEETKAVLEKFSKNPPKPGDTGPEMAYVEEVVVPRFSEQVSKLSAIGAPRGDEEEVSKILESLQGVVTLAEDDPTEYLKQIETETPFKRPARLAATYGLVGCAEV